MFKFLNRVSISGSLSDFKALRSKHPDVWKSNFARNNEAIDQPAGFDAGLMRDLGENSIAEEHEDLMKKSEEEGHQEIPL